MNPLELIAVGSTGLRIVERFWKLAYTVFQEGVRDLNIMNYVLLETDQRQRLAGPLAEYRVNISAGQGRHNIQSLSDAKKYFNEQGVGLFWFDALALSPTEAFSTISGAGGNRPYGRLSLWLSWMDVYNRLGHEMVPGVKQRARERLEQFAITRHFPVKAEELLSDLSARPSTYVVGTLCGGTGAGTFIDIGFMARERTQGNSELTGIFLLPPLGYQGDAVNASVYAALGELQHVYSHGYVEQWPDRSFKTYTGDQFRQPYDTVFLLEPHDRDSTLDELCDLVALRLFLGFMGLHGRSSAIRVDAANEIDRGEKWLFTFNLGGILYPKYEIAETAASVAATALIDWWLREPFRAPGGNTIDPIAIRSRGREAVARAAEEALATLESLPGDSRTPLHEEVYGASEASVLESIRTGKATNVDLQRRFERYGEQFRHHTVIETVSRRAADELLRAVHDAEQNRSVHYVRQFLTGIDEGLREVETYWRNVWRPGSVSEAVARTWELTGWKEILERRAKLRDHLRYVLRLSAIGALIDSPAFQRVGIIIRDAINLNEIEATLTRTRDFLRDDHNRLEQYLARPSVTLLKVDRFGNRLDGTRTAEELTHWAIPLDESAALFSDPWPLFREPEETFKEHLKDRLISEIFRRQADTHLDVSAAQQTVLTEYHARVWDGGLHFKGGANVLSDRNRSKGFPHFLIGQESENASHALNLQARDARNGPLQLPFIRDMLVFYVEKANFRLEDLKIWDDTRTAYQQRKDKNLRRTFPFDDSQATALLLDRIRKARVTRETEATLADLTAQLIELLLLVFPVWQPDPLSKQLFPVAVRHEFDSSPRLLQRQGERLHLHLTPGRLPTQIFELYPDYTVPRELGAPEYRDWFLKTVAEKLKGIEPHRLVSILDDTTTRELIRLRAKDPNNFALHAVSESGPLARLAKLA